ncbi:MAG: carotenoid biosynthesis protein [Ignavibacteria bacterium]|nr:carotenoid biosynthesis protein [Ignavibacteria bacterium]
MNRRVLLTGLYVFFVAGGVWNTLRLFESVMTVLTPFVMVAVGVTAFVSTYELNLKSVAAGVTVLLVTFLSEASGANLGFPFGEYAYTDRLGPKLLDVPLVIPFAWLGVLVPAWISSGHFLKFKKVVVASILVTVFDAIMEFAADALDLWHWKGGLPTELNYISWFVISYGCLSLLNRYAKEKVSNPLVAHLLASQLVYFVLTNVGMRFVNPQA